MNLADEPELMGTRQKLGWLEARYQEQLDDPSELTYARRSSMRSLKRLINQMKEEIVRYEASLSHDLPDRATR